MSSLATTPPLIAGGTIAPSTFLKLSTVADRTILAAGANGPIFGIAGVSTRNYQLASDALGTGFAAGDEVNQFVDGEPCSLLLGGTVTRGDFLRSDANSAAVVGGIGIDNIGARALESGVAGQYIKVMPFIQHAAGAGGSSGAWRQVTTPQTLTAADSGTRVGVTLVTSAIITLPPVATLVPGDRFTIVGMTATTSGVGLTVTINAVLPDTAFAYGGLALAPAAGKGVTNTQATSKPGDRVTLEFDGTNFNIVELIGTWVRQA